MSPSPRSSNPFSPIRVHESPTARYKPRYTVTGKNPSPAYPSHCTNPLWHSALGTGLLLFHATGKESKYLLSPGRPQKSIPRVARASRWPPRVWQLGCVQGWELRVRGNRAACYSHPPSRPGLQPCLSLKQAAGLLAGAPGRADRGSRLRSWEGGRGRGPVTAAGKGSRQTHSSHVVVSPTPGGAGRQRDAELRFQEPRAATAAAEGRAVGGCGLLC